MRTHRPSTGSKIPKIGKRGFRGRKTTISHQPRKGSSSQKIPNFSTGPTAKKGIFWLEPLFSWERGVFERNPLFPILGIVTPAQGLCVRKVSYHAVGNYYLKYSWETLCKQICITYSCLWVPRILQVKCITYPRDIPAPPNKSCMRQFPSAW